MMISSMKSSSGAGRGCGTRWRMCLARADSILYSITTNRIADRGSVAATARTTESLRQGPDRHWDWVRRPVLVGGARTLRRLRRHGSDLAGVVAPAAASSAEAENVFALTCTATAMSLEPSTSTWAPCPDGTLAIQVGPCGPRPLGASEPPAGPG